MASSAMWLNLFFFFVFVFCLGFFNDFCRTHTKKKSKQTNKPKQNKKDERQMRSRHGSPSGVLSVFVFKFWTGRDYKTSNQIILTLTSLTSDFYLKMIDFWYLVKFANMKYKCLHLFNLLLQTFLANTDAWSPVTIIFPAPIKTQLLRIKPTTSHGWVLSDLRY